MYVCIHVYICVCLGNHKERDEVMEAFKHGLIRVIVATDVLARGIDFPELK